MSAQDISAKSQNRFQHCVLEYYMFDCPLNSDFCHYYAVDSP